MARFVKHVFLAGAALLYATMGSASRSRYTTDAQESDYAAAELERILSVTRDEEARHLGGLCWKEWEVCLQEKVDAAEEKSAEEHSRHQRLEEQRPQEEQRIRDEILRCEDQARDLIAQEREVAEQKERLRDEREREREQKLQLKQMKEEQHLRVASGVVARMRMEKYCTDAQGGFEKRRREWDDFIRNAERR